jgi:hypothetical protein
VFGSVAWGTKRPDSDIDLLLVADDLPHGHVPPVHTFEAVERRLESLLAEAAQDGMQTTGSSVRNAQELGRGSLLFLDTTKEVLLLHNPAGT